ncbi:MAG TPA: nucleotidyltransferase domain-containing protein [Thermoanaerobaculia bacterium]
MDPERIAEDVRRFFADEPGDAVAVYLFGSVARGTAHAESDVDVGVLLAEDPPRTLEGLKLDVDRAGPPPSAYLDLDWHGCSQGCSDCTYLRRISSGSAPAKSRSAPP